MIGEFGVSAATLHALAIFRDMPPAAMEAIARVASVRRVARNALVVHAGERTDSVYLIASGHLRVVVSNAQGREMILSTLGPGELFGEMGMLDEHPRSATVIALSPCQLLVITKADFRRCLQDNVEVTRYLMRNLVQRLRDADRKIESLALMDVYGRVARLLLEMAETVDGKRVITRKISKQEIAKMIGASREMVSRIMSALQRAHLIEETEGRIVLHDRIAA